MGVLTAGGIPHWMGYRPLTLALVFLLLLPAFPVREHPVVREHGESAPLFQANAQDININCTPSPTAILRVLCPEGIINIGFLNRFEETAVKAYLGLHGLPESDANVIYTLGRSDLRSEIRAIMLTTLLGIIQKPAAQRTADERNIYVWMQTLIRKNEINMYEAALGELARFQRNACTYTLHPVIAEAYDISYSGQPFCGGISRIFQPPVPAESYFRAYGLLKSYGVPGETHPDFASLIANTSLGVAATAGIAAAGGVVAGLATAVALAAQSVIAVVTGTLLSAAAITTMGVMNTTIGLMLAGNGLSAIGGVAATAAGPAAVILLAVAAGVLAAMTLDSNAKTLAALDNMNTELSSVLNAPPDLLPMVTDSVGLYKLKATLVAQTLPEVPATAPLPAHRLTDPNFAVSTGSGSPQIVSTLRYAEPAGGPAWELTTWGGWFIKTCLSGSSCPQKDSITAMLKTKDLTDPSVSLAASRMGNRFTITKFSPDSDDAPCVADAITGLSPGTDFKKCSSYVSKTIPLVAPNSNSLRVSLSELAPPAFTGADTLAFGQGIQATRTISVTGNPVPTVCPKTPNLSPDFRLDGCREGSLQLTFNGNRNAANATYNLTLTADNGIGAAVEKTLKVTLSPQLAILSPNLLSATAGFPVDFTVVATGNPTPRLSATPELSLGNRGLSFRDNGDGTATISGTPNSPGTWGCIDAEKCAIVATNSQGTVIQPFSLAFGQPPSASFASLDRADFIAGVPNSTTLRTTNAVTRVNWILLRGPDPWTNAAVDPNPAWLSLKDNGNGTAVLSGTPPVGVSGSFVVRIFLQAEGSLRYDIVPYTITVQNVPMFTTGGAAPFIVGTHTTFAIQTNQGTVSLTDTLPKNLTFTGGVSPGITGTPEPGTGGQYTVNLKVDAGEAGTTSQPLTLNIFEAPSITSPDTATFVAGTPGTFKVTTLGYPSIGVIQGMRFSVTGLPPSLKTSSTNPWGFPTGSLTIEGTPSASEAGVYSVQITAENGVGGPARQNLRLTVQSSGAGSLGDTISSTTSTNGDLREDQKLISSNGGYEALMQGDGNFVVYLLPHRQPIWATNTNGRGAPPYRMSVQSDGNLALYGSTGLIWHIGLRGGTAPFSLTMQDDGNLVLYDSQRRAIWAIRSVSVGDTISSSVSTNGDLRQDQKLISKNGRFEALVQSDGNFVIYAEPDRQPIWASNTSGRGAPPYRLSVQSDGNLALYGSTGLIWHIGLQGGTAPFSLIMQDDGNLVLYDSERRAIWASGTQR